MSTKTFLSLFLLGFVINSSGICQDRNQFVSEASFIVGTYKPAEPDYTPVSMAKRAADFLASLDEKQREKATHTIDSAERREWTNLPTPQDARGLRFGEMNEKQAKSACDLMASLLSEHGYRKVVNIMLADDQLLRKGRARPGFGTENFHVVVFGTPSATEPWAFQLDGHHVGVNISITGENLTMSPSFIGTQPQYFNLGDKRIRPLTGEIDDAYKLVGLLSDEQRKAAVIGDHRGDLIAGPGQDNRVPDARGVSCSTFDEKQKEVLLGLIQQWVSDLPPAHAEQRMAQLKEEVDQMKFSWNGAIEVGSDISYRIQGPTLIVEYACQSLGGDPQQHLHTMYRNPENEYGLQIGSAR